MSDTPPAADWWQASDGKWYPPEQHPDYRPPEQPPSQYNPYTPPYSQPTSDQPFGTPPSAPPGYAPGYGQRYGQGYDQQYGQPYGATYGSPYGAPAQQTSSKATVALVLSIVSFVICPVIPAIVALVMAGQASKEIRDSGGRFTGQGLVTASRIIAIANLVLGVLAAVGIALLIAAAPDVSDNIEGFADDAMDRSMQADLRNGLTAERMYFTDHGEYTDNTTELSQLEPSVGWVQGTVPAGSQMVFVDSFGDEVVLGGRSPSGDCFYIRDMNGSSTQYAHDPDCGSFDVQEFVTSW